MSEQGRRAERIGQFEQRKRDHIQLSLDPSNQATGFSGLEQIRLQHEAIPELDFVEVDISSKRFGQSTSSPFLVSSMTAGHNEATNLNRTMAEACQARGWAMGVGSQRRQLTDATARQEWVEIRKTANKVDLLGNIGLAQLIQSSTDDIKCLVDSLEACAMIVHTNPVQECLQPEGTPQFKGGYQALERLVQELHVPVVVKETGCGFAKSTLERLNNVGVAAVDVSGLGGTHWGRIEGKRSSEQDMLAAAAETFKNWGISTIESLISAMSITPNFEIWGSGGVRSGLDAAKLLALGANTVGFAKPIIEAALAGPIELDNLMQRYEYELKMAMFCSGCRIIGELQEKLICQY